MEKGLLMKGYTVLLVLGFFLAGFVFNAAKTMAADYYVCGTASDCGPGWTGGKDSNSCDSRSMPCATIAAGTSRMSAGDNLIIGNGTYIRDQVADVPAGTASKHTSVMAESDGGVVIDGQLAINPLMISYSNIDITGLKLINGNNVVAYINGSNNTIKRTAFGNVNDGPDNSIVSLGGSYNTIEDCWVWGAGRAGIYVGGDHGIIRRVVIRKDYHSSGTEDVGILLYHATDTIIENAIALDFNPATVAGNYGDFRAGFRSREGYGAKEHNFFGSIALNLPNPSYIGYHGFRLAVGSCDNCVIWDVGGYGIWGTYNAGYKIDHSTAGETGGTAFYNLGMPVINSLTNPSAASLPYLLRPTAGDGAHIEYRYEGGILTQEQLWPWPNEERIKKDFQTTFSNIPASHQNAKRGFASDGIGLYGGPITLTSYIWEYLGNPCPADICDYQSSDTTPPVLSNSAPSGTLPGGTTSVTLSLTSDEAASCRYSTTTGTGYASMTNMFTITGGTNHSTNITNLEDGSSYTYYVRCVDGAGNANTNDYEISFNVSFSVIFCGASDNNPTDGAVSITELMSYISNWENGIVIIGDLMTAIGEWKNGCQ